MRRKPVRLRLLELESRDHPSATATLVAGTLNITADSLGGRLDVFQDGTDIVVRSRGTIIGSFDAASVTSLNVIGGPGSDIVRIDNAITIPATLTGADSSDKISGGGGVTTLDGGDGNDLLVGGILSNSFDPSTGNDHNQKVLVNDTNVPGPDTQSLQETIAVPPPVQTMSTSDVNTILDRASAASASDDGIIVIVDRNGRILGVRVESGVDPAITGNNANLVFAIDGAVSLARTAAFFASDQAPLTSRTVENLSQSTITEREVDSNPSITDPNSTVRGPGLVAPVGIGGHFPPNVPDTPQVDLYEIELTNRDGTYAPGPDGIIGTADDVLLPERFNDPAAFVPDGQELFPPDSYGVDSGLSATVNNVPGGIPIAESRGIATLPGGVPIYKNGQLVGGIGVFFPGKTGYATEENSQLSSTYDPSKPDRSLEAEWIAFAAAGGASGNGLNAQVGTIGGVALPPGYTGSPYGRIDLNGITLDIYGPGGNTDGPKEVIAEGQAVGVGVVNGVNEVVDPTPLPGDTATLRAGLPAPSGWLVLPHDGVGITEAQVLQIITQGINQANQTRAAIRVPYGEPSKMVFAVADKDGNIVGLYRMPDATIFSIDVAVAKARNVSYYANSSLLQPIDQLPGVDPGTAFTNRTFGYLANSRYPTGIDGSPPGYFSILNDGGTNPLTGLNTGAPLPASAFQSVLGYDAFNPDTNFRDPDDKNNQNGIVFFPGSVPIYANNALIGGFGVSGDGVTEDDVVTGAGASGFGTAPGVQRADQVVFRSVRLPYQEFTRNPTDL